MTGRAAHVGERSGVGTSAKPPPRLPRALGGLWARGKELWAGKCAWSGKDPPGPSPTPLLPQAAAYGRCVQASTAPGGRLRKDLCAQEFEALRSCFAAAVGGRPAIPGSQRRLRGGNQPAFSPTFGVGRSLALPALHADPPVLATPAATELVPVSVEGHQPHREHGVAGVCESAL